MKKQKRMLCFVSAICLLITCLMVPDKQAAASTASTKEHIQLKQTGGSFEVKFQEGDYKIANLKASSKNLVLRTTYVSSSDMKNSYNKEYPWGYARIGMYAKKKGTYTVTFNVVDRNNRVKKSHSVKVYATDEYPIKNVTFAGKTEFYGIASKAKGKFKVNMTKGYKIQSIIMTTYNKSGSAVTKKIKNGQSVTLGKYRAKTMFVQGEAGREDWQAELLARTEFKITYKDKYTKESKTGNYTLYRVPLN